MSGWDGAPTRIEAEVDAAIDDGFTGKALEYEVDRRVRNAARSRTRIRDTWPSRPKVDPWRFQ